jgi:hypothetical protein
MLCALIRTHNGGISSGPAKPDVSFFDDGYIRNAVISGQVVGSGKPMQPTPYDHRLVIGFQFGLFSPQGFMFKKHHQCSFMVSQLVVMVIIKYQLELIALCQCKKTCQEKKKLCLK